MAINTGKNFNPVYRVGRAMSGFLFNNCFQAECEGLQWVPKSGPFLLATNHVSYFDPFLAGAFVNRDIYYFARKTLFKPGIVSWALHHFNAIPVDRDAGNDISAFKSVLKVLKSGHGLLVFPEGTRSPDGTLQPAKRGVGMMACKVQVPVVPARIFGADKAWRRNNKLPSLGAPLSITYGKPIFPEDYDPGSNNSNRYQIASNTILACIKALERS